MTNFKKYQGYKYYWSESLLMHMFVNIMLDVTNVHVTEVDKREPITQTGEGGVMLRGTVKKNRVEAPPLESVVNVLK